MAISSSCVCVRWYITYRLSYRDLAEMMAERGIEAAHTTVLRWVIRYVPEVEKRCGRFSKPVGALRSVDETYVPIKGQWRYLYRAVGKHGKTVDFMLRPDRGIAAVLAFFRKALETPLPHVPRKGTLDGHVPSHRALWLRRREHPCWRNVKLRSRNHLNNIIACDQAVLRLHGRMQAGHQRRHHDLGHCACASHSETSVLLRTRSATPRLVAERRMRNGTCIDDRRNR